ncbi:linear amide C-N hydrolase [Pseudobutyrivibrio xylanivorans]|uniref:Linear amide C-N hydrolase n=1 Tax=Pseudobutyrivibrio xylanivorans TaxID=185007 RepID=A0A5P6VW79_PSEXY|nr:linear amide C-N hydrolase [Pseudobutyrivibrio xylanivorans]
MCTAATYYSKDHYFGRNLDLEFSYNETVTIMPRGYKFPIRHADDLANWMLCECYIVAKSYRKL